MLQLASRTSTLTFPEKYIYTWKQAIVESQGTKLDPIPVTLSVGSGFVRCRYAPYVAAPDGTFARQRGPPPAVVAPLALLPATYCTYDARRTPSAVAPNWMNARNDDSGNA